MKVLITGVSGFIGGRLLDRAIAVWGEENVVALSSEQSEKCQTITYDFHNGFALEASQIALLGDVTLLIHAGAFTPKASADANDVVRCNQNIYVTQQLLELPFVSLEKIIYISTLDVYAPSVLISESSLVQPSTLYGWSKLYSEQLVLVRAREMKVAQHILRIGHVYGPGEERYAKFLPKAIQAIISGAAVELYGDGAELRSFIYIDDVVEAIFSAVGLSEDVGVINIVGGRALSIKSVLEKLIAISGKEVPVVVREMVGMKRDFIFDTKLMNEKLLPVEKDFLLGLKEEYDYFAKII